eukprot:TRINITY_DN5598_c0_g1_i4.p1 TRINITY_DN5598_c0_g1~~TRINITY_DN5598_c0_g1_i4.p1  ORF type:complete len:545 (+),score=172.19 TRINITY_DN5598_c0_g1_i4:79-1713(+)
MAAPPQAPLLPHLGASLQAAADAGLAMLAAASDPHGPPRCPSTTGSAPSSVSSPCSPLRRLPAQMSNVAKRQRLHDDATTEHVAAVLRAVEAARQRLQEGGADAEPRELLAEVKAATTAAEAATAASAAEQLELLGQQQQLLEDAFAPNPQLYHNEPDATGERWTDRKELVLQAIAEHLHHTGRSHIADMLAAESEELGLSATLPQGSELQERFRELRGVCVSLRQRSVDDALSWVQRMLSHADGLLDGADAALGQFKVAESPAAASDNAGGQDAAPPRLSRRRPRSGSQGPRARTTAAHAAAVSVRRLRELAFQLFRLRTLGLMREGRRGEALSFLRTHVAQQAAQKPEWWRVFLELAGGLAFVGSCPQSPRGSIAADGQRASPVNVPLPPTPKTPVGAVRAPYSWLHDDDTTLWREAEALFRRCWCELWVEPLHSPLATCIAAGAEALPTLQRYLCLPAVFRTSKELHMPALPRELQFRSVVSCPVTQQVCTHADGPNPAMLMPCGHVVCRNAVLTLAHNGRLKCPYCPSDCAATQCQPLRF